MRPTPSTPSQRALQPLALALASLLLSLLIYTINWWRAATSVPGGWAKDHAAAGGGVPSNSASNPHPIAHLTAAAEARFAALVAAHPTTLADAAADYRRARGRHPPPGFAAWFAFA
ncbi:hypothetical protein P171DRAFT_434192 [Karstenula rhodostoma CBS 690.94]|uniref:Uncharacterized protein n=1 Tax=Karstenula rhodostoma CBS 690.94 TaxID=1392251 RepID=A0A9P4PAN8_9PLEO|nr:hypothetical protein P171DRAFT_434192 [Karstenula rhodostoma CBS 690.94]